MNVVFEEQPLVRNTASAPRGMVGWMLRAHLASSASGAQTTLIVLAIACLITSALLGRMALATRAIDTGKNFVPAVLR